MISRSIVEPDGNTAVFDNYNAGNKVDPINGGFLSDFHIVNPIVSLTTPVADKPLTFAGEYILNTGAKSDDDANGYAVGASLGKLVAKGDWNAYYQYQRVQQEAVFSPVAQDDFQQSTNFQGHVFGRLSPPPDA